MHANTYFFFPQQWDAQDLADAVLPRLHELLDFDVLRDAPGIGTANSSNLVTRTRHNMSYVPGSAFNALFRVR